MHAVGEITFPNCEEHHDRGENATKNIRAEGIRQLSVLGTRTAEAWRGYKTKKWTKVCNDAIPD